MIPLAVGLTLASYATAQYISMVAMPVAMGSSSASPSSSMSGPPAPTMPSYGADSSPPPAYGSSGNQYGGYSAASAQYTPPSQNQYGGYSAPPAQYTPPPQTMPYSSFMAGGYMSMDCGYGYNKGSDGSCTSTESWVRNTHFQPFRAMRFIVVNHV